MEAGGVILFATNADTELLALRSVLEDLPGELSGTRGVHPDRAGAVADLVGAGAGARGTDLVGTSGGAGGDTSRQHERPSIVVVRLLGGRAAWESPFDELRAWCRTTATPLVALGGEAEPDAELAEASTVPAGVVATAHRYLAAGGPANIAQLLRFLSDTLLLTGHGFDAPVELPGHGVWDGAGIGRPGAARRPDRPLVAVIFYRAHLVAGNTTYVAELCDAIEAAGADALAIYTYSLRATGPAAAATAAATAGAPAATPTVPAVELCRQHGADVVITSTLAAGAAAGGAARATGAYGGDEADGWEAPALAALGVPIIQTPASSRSRDDWQADDAGLSPVDVAMGVAIPEFDGRVIGPSVAFKEFVDDAGRPGGEAVATRTDPERAARLARLAVRHARLRHLANGHKRVAVVLSAYPTKRSRLGNAVGLDTPASAVRLLAALQEAGYGLDRERIPEHGDALMAELAGNLTYESPRLTDAQATSAAGHLDTDVYEAWYATLPDDARHDLEAVWGPAPGEVYAHDGALAFPGLDLGNVLVTIQPPRGFGADPIGTYHAPDLPPPHHYLAFYRWLAAPQAEGGWGADAVIHLGKHGTLEWLPGKALGLSAACFPDVGIDDLPFAYPFVVNDPGEGTQAKRRTHAVVIDHLPPPLTRADSYDEVAELERLLDTYAQAQAMDPAKLPRLREQVWELLVSAEIHRDLDLGDAAPAGDAFDDLILHVDGYLCALKDAQIRGGLHVLGAPPAGGALVDDVLAITRLPQGQVPSLRSIVAAELGVDLGDRQGTDRVEARCRELVEDLAATGWDPASTGDPTLRWVAGRLVPNLARTTDELRNVLAFLDGRPVPAGPSGAPSRGGAHVLPTGRNFYSVDPKAIPSPLAWEVGQGLADRLVERHREETGRVPATVGLVLWGTAAMRTTGDDAAEALALLGVRPQWDPESQRVVGLEAIPLAELGRPRIDVTLRISGFFRDAFPHVVDLLDDAVSLVARLDEDPADNPVRAAGTADARLYGPPPGGYGSGILPVLEQGSWRTDDDLAEVYLAWSGFAYGRGRHGAAHPDAMRRRFAAIEVAVKNQDNREHDIFDSDDYLQDHGGMVAAVRALTGTAPRAWFGDSADPADPRVRSLAEEAARVVRSRVLNPKWIAAMQAHGYKGAFELAATVDYLFGYDATAHVVEDWMYERVTSAYVADPRIRKFFEQSNPAALRAIAERLLEADQRDLWDASPQARQALEQAVLEGEGWEERT
jgi:cobaltochelatase CobN